MMCLADQLILCFNTILYQAKADYERKERVKELSKQKGEGTWILPSLNDRIEQDSEMIKKTKKRKKDKKKKKKKKKKVSDSSSEVSICCRSELRKSLFYDLWVGRFCTLTCFAVGQ